MWLKSTASVRYLLITLYLIGPIGRKMPGGSHKFDKNNFPDPKKMVDEVHTLNTNIMISVWPKFYPTTDNYKELAEKGYMLTKNVDPEANLDWIGKGYLNGFYDPYPKEAQEIFWRQLKENINVLGFDAWWLDASEPDIHSNLSFSKRKEIMSPLSVGSGAEYFNSYALANAEGVYKGERATDGDKRSFILTRSGFAGIQRTGSAIWSGDTVPRWTNLKEQIGAGIGAGLAGMPNWTFDIGGFTPPKISTVIPVRALSVISPGLMTKMLRTGKS